jgi:hypothetical protein
VAPPAGTGLPYRRNLRGGWRISRADVAHFMLAALDQPQSLKQMVGIAY